MDQASLGVAAMLCLLSAGVQARATPPSVLFILGFCFAWLCFFL